MDAAKTYLLAKGSEPPGTVVVTGRTLTGSAFQAVVVWVPPRKPILHADPCLPVPPNDTNSPLSFYSTDNAIDTFSDGSIRYNVHVMNNFLPYYVTYTKYVR